MWNKIKKNDKYFYQNSIVEWYIYFSQLLTSNLPNLSVCHEIKYISLIKFYLMILKFIPSLYIKCKLNISMIYFELNCTKYTRTLSKIRELDIISY